MGGGSQGQGNEINQDLYWGNNFDFEETRQPSYQPSYDYGQGSNQPQQPQQPTFNYRANAFQGNPGFQGNQGSQGNQGYVNPMWNSFNQNQGGWGGWYTPPAQSPPAQSPPARGPVDATLEGSQDADFGGSQDANLGGSQDAVESNQPAPERWNASQRDRLLHDMMQHMYNKSGFRPTSGYGDFYDDTQDVRFKGGPGRPASYSAPSGWKGAGQTFLYTPPEERQYASGFGPSIRGHRSTHYTDYTAPGYLSSGYNIDDEGNVTDRGRAIGSSAFTGMGNLAPAPHMAEAFMRGGNQGIGHRSFDPYAHMNVNWNYKQGGLVRRFNEGGLAQALPLVEDEMAMGEMAGADMAMAQGMAPPVGENILLEEAAALDTGMPPEDIFSEARAAVEKKLLAHKQGVELSPHEEMAGDDAINAFLQELGEEGEMALARLVQAVKEEISLDPEISVEDAIANAEPPSPGIAGLEGMQEEASLIGDEDLAMAESIPGYRKGGALLSGRGDGMSDSIPATIDGAEPIRVSEGETIIPADVTSALGNGSSEAGAQRLMDMVERIRMARTGTAQQPPAIDARKFVPA